jgi:hypothetical protein
LWRIGVPDLDQILRVGIGKGPKQKIFDHAENRGVRSNPERQREYGNCAKGRSSCKVADSVANVFQKAVEHEEFLTQLGIRVFLFWRFRV